MVKQALAAVALAALVACGGGGGGGGGGSFGAAPKAEAPTPAPVAVAAPPLKVSPTNPGCVIAAVNHLSCDLVASDGPIGVGVEPGMFVTFTNRTGGHLQINDVIVETGERRQWSEFCIYLDDFLTGQNEAGKGEVGCSSKAVGEDYSAIRFGEGNGLAVAPGSVVYLASHSQPTGLNHTYALTVRKQSAGLTSWRQPQHDAVIACTGQWQSTAMSPLENKSGRNLTLTGVSIYAESGSSNTLNGPACIYVMKANGSPKYSACDAAFSQRGEVKFSTPWTVEPGEFIAGQGRNACAAPAGWGWAAFIQVW